jgi:serine phosphatase RsbU (regulator of sigma subunit)
MARQIQLSILPQTPPRLQGLDIEARYIPMSSVAGDFYDFVIVDDKHVGILIADVSGHGLASALIASMLQSALAAQASKAGDPAAVLSGLNRALSGKFKSSFVTAAYLFVDMENRTVRYGGAAHPPVLLWRSKTGSAAEWLQNGLMLGPFPDATYSAVTLPLEEGDKIVLVTDGIIEAVNSSAHEFGMERLHQILQSNHALQANRFADALLDELSRWSEAAIGPGQSDDITLLAIDFNGLPQA